MKTKTVLKSVAVLVCALCSVVCTHTKSRDYSLTSQAAISPSPPAAQHISSPLPNESPKSIANSSIRSVDFNKITYRNVPKYSGSKARHVTLKAGRGKPSYATFGDATGDGVEEAMIVLSVENRGSAIPHCVYVFTWENGQAKLLWDFETGDRADGGLRQVYSEDSQLVVELFGKDRFVGGELYKGDEGLCCPRSFTRTRYRWTGKDFHQMSTEVLANPNGNASPLMPPYSGRQPMR